MTTLFIFIRHGQTEDNVRDIATGTNESPLTTLGRGQARERAYEIKKFKPDVLYTSPLGRAVETAEIIGDYLGLTPVIDRLLIERFVGTQMQKITNAKGQELLGAEFEELQKMPLPHQLRYRYTLAPEAQTPEEKVREIMRFMEDAAARHPGQTVAAVSHGAALGNLLVAHGMLPFVGIYGADGIHNTTYFVMQYDSTSGGLTLTVGPSSH